MQKCQGKAGSLEEHLQAAWSIVDRLTSQHRADLQDLLLPEGHPFLMAELARRMAHREKAGFESTGGSWPQQHLQIIKNNGLHLSDCGVPQRISQSKWFKSMCLRDQQVLGLALALNAGVDLETVDVSQSASRVPCGKEGLPSTLKGFL
jgi:hypothetical protein